MKEVVRREEVRRSTIDLTLRHITGAIEQAHSPFLVELGEWIDMARLIHHGTGTAHSCHFVFNRCF